MRCGHLYGWFKLCLLCRGLLLQGERLVLYCMRGRFLPSVDRIIKLQQLQRGSCLSFFSSFHNFLIFAPRFLLIFQSLTSFKPPRDATWPARAVTLVCSVVQGMSSPTLDRRAARHAQAASTPRRARLHVQAVRRELIQPSVLQRAPTVSRELIRHFSSKD